MRSLGSINVQDHVDRLFELQNALSLRGADGPHINGHALERRIEQLMSV